MKLIQDHNTSQPQLFCSSWRLWKQNRTGQVGAETAQAEAGKVTDPAHVQLQSRGWGANQKCWGANGSLVTKETHREPQKGGKQGCTQPKDPRNSLLSVVNACLVWFYHLLISTFLQEEKEIPSLSDDWSFPSSTSTCYSGSCAARQSWYSEHTLCSGSWPTHLMLHTLI